MDVCERVNSSNRRLFVEQIATVVALGCGRKVDAMWHVPLGIKAKKCLYEGENYCINGVVGSRGMGYEK